MAVTASSKQHVDALNDTIQHARLDAGHLDATTAVPIGGGEHARTWVTSWSPVATTGSSTWWTCTWSSVRRAGASFAMGYLLTHDGAPCCTAVTEHASVDDRRPPARLPAWRRELVDAHPHRSVVRPAP